MTMAPVLRTGVVILLGLTAAAGPVATPAGPVELSPAEAAKVVAGIEARRAKAQEWLRRDTTSYLATVDRRDFGEATTMTLGRAADNDLRLDADGIAAHHLRVTVEGARFRVEAVDPGATFTADGAPAREALVDPSSIRVGRLTLRLSHQNFPAIIVFDPESPRFAEYKGLDYYPVDVSYRFELALTPNPTPEAIVIMSTRGTPRRAIRIGWFDFRLGGRAYRLEATRLVEPGIGEEAASVFFRDATSGVETYPLGRYVDAERLPDGRYLLDFNLAYNPACAYSTHYNCPLPPRANTLDVEIRAGEKDAHYH